MKYLKRFESVIDTNKKIIIITDIMKVLDYEDVNIPVKTDNYDIIIDGLSYKSDEDCVLVYYSDIYDENDYDDCVQDLDSLDVEIIDSIYNYLEIKILPLTIDEYVSGKDMGLL